MTPTTESSLPNHKEKKREEEETEQKKRKENVINNVINTHTIRLIKTFSVAPDKLAVFHKFDEIARREAGPRGFSEVLLRAMAEYNLRHNHGNPQFLLTTYLDPQAPSPMRVVCWSNLAGATSDGKVYCRKYGGWIQAIKCYSCSNNQLKKKGPK